MVSIYGPSTIDSYDNISREEQCSYHAVRRENIFAENELFVFKEIMRISLMKLFNVIL